MTDLSEFLLARIAEDETGAEMLRQREAVDGVVNTWLMQPVVARVLAECDAKRRIVQEYDLAYRTEYRAGLGVALRLLALPYADHPDYDQEWRP